MRIAPLAVGGIVKEWQSLWEYDPGTAIIPLDADAVKALKDFRRSDDIQIVVNVGIEVTPCG